MYTRRTYNLHIAYVEYSIAEAISKLRVEDFIPYTFMYTFFFLQTTRPCIECRILECENDTHFGKVSGSYDLSTF